MGYYIGMGFNRNIVGCKVFLVYRKSTVARDLIETLWDVKTDRNADIAKLTKDLIETLWDVKL